MKLVNFFLRSRHNTINIIFNIYFLHIQYNSIKWSFNTNILNTVSNRSMQKAYAYWMIWSNVRLDQYDDKIFRYIK